MFSFFSSRSLAKIEIYNTCDKLTLEACVTSDDFSRDTDGFLNDINTGEFTFG
jgi:hypothetical protein